MVFVNEWVSAEDVKKYELDIIWKKVKGHTPIDYIWTIDRDRNAFFFPYESGRDDISNRIDFVLCWDGVVHTIGLTKNSDHLEGIENSTTTWSQRWFKYGGGMHSKEEVIDTIKEALRAFKVFGIALSVEHHTAVFEF